MSEEASECRRGPEGSLNVQKEAYQADLLTETFDIGQHQLLLFIVFLVYVNMFDICKYYKFVPRNTG